MKNFSRGALQIAPQHEMKTHHCLRREILNASNLKPLHSCRFLTIITPMKDKRNLKLLGLGLFWLTSFTFSSCRGRQEVSTGMFEINKEVSCEDLMDQGFAWMPGEDVILFGKRTGDTLDYYHMDDKKGSFLFGSLQQEDEEFVERDVEVCRKLRPVWRNIVVEIKKQETSTVVGKIDRTKYTVIEQPEEGYYIYWAKVVNKETLDTFNFSVYEQDKKYFVSSTIHL